MKLKTKGLPNCIAESIVGRVTFDPFTISDNSILLTDGGLDPFVLQNFEAVLTTAAFKDRIDYPSVYEIPDFNHLAEGDIIVVHSDGVINTVYRVASEHNFLLFTERCNSNCLMCSQPPRDKDDSRLAHLYKRIIPLIPKNCTHLGITGGEPTLLGDLYFELLNLISRELPNTNIHCLTNGRSFAWPHFTKRLDENLLNKLMLAIPLYADNYIMHDYIVQAKGAFNQTLNGLYQLADIGARLEIRIVLHQLSVQRLSKLARFIYKNLPFVDHVAFMGLEYQGYTPHNIEKLWQDPVEYSGYLSEAVLYLFDMGMNVSIYNHQLCVTPQELWPFCQRSISDWKNVYLPVCENCEVRNQCGGFFASSIDFYSENIHPIKTSCEEKIIGD
jgi:His-Xaa-Ser system radical SAM maturase HxsC